MNSSVHFWKNEGPPSCVGARGPRKTPCGAGGLDSHRQNGFVRGFRFYPFRERVQIPPIVGIPFRHASGMMPLTG